MQTLELTAKGCCKAYTYYVESNHFSISSYCIYGFSWLCLLTILDKTDLKIFILYAILFTGQLNIFQIQNYSNLIKISWSLTSFLCVKTITIANVFRKVTSQILTYSADTAIGKILLHLTIILKQYL